GEMYNLHRDDAYKESDLRARVSELMKDSDVKNKSGIYWYVMDGNEHHLDIRTFDSNMKREVYERQKGICPICGGHFEIEEMEADHITPWCKGGHTKADNCQMLCRDCNRRKSGK
ncbi:MAG: HNH endonuclease, partial [Bacteroidales bacterium]|nr:HNH endonuclease [Bacteroidales bacterium]